METFMFIEAHMICAFADLIYGLNIKVTETDAVYCLKRTTNKLNEWLIIFPLSIIFGLFEAFGKCSAHIYIGWRLCFEFNSR